MRRDPLAALARMRAAETLLARRALSGAASSLAGAEAAVAGTVAALRAEAQLRAEGPADPAFPDWVRRALAERDAAARQADAAAAAVASARAEVAAARAAERLVETALLRRAAEERRDAMRRESVRLGDLRPRIRKAPSPAVPSAD
ncbi:hypothetical protein ACE7GA_15965 [Roseomonas sp. CCTCC AB2023176]|uniref:hypothetical protein n=1 Tax=Roseomonas sp. CCTCC AB2023176 TaxID=3342640 RepID=UPI0035E11C28